MDLKYDNEKCCSVPMERASRELLLQLERMAVERRPEVCFGCAALLKAAELLRQ